MANETKIEWCDSTLNLEMGCAGCELWNPAKGITTCYAGRLVEKYGGRKGWPKNFRTPQIFPERMNLALRWGDLTGMRRASKPWLNWYPRLIFLNDMGDTFTDGLAPDWLAQFLPAISHSSHQFLVLTKRPAAAATFFRKHGLPVNVWIGVSVTSPDNLSRLDYLRRPPLSNATIRFVSIEPVLRQGIFIKQWTDCLDWVIAGGGTGPDATPIHGTVFRKIRNDAKDADLPFFFKSHGEWIHEMDCPPDMAAAGFPSHEFSDKTLAFRVGPLATHPGIGGKEWREMPLIEKLRSCNGTAQDLFATAGSSSSASPMDSGGDGGNAA